MSKELVIVFVKNIRLGHVKTRLAQTIGDQGASEVYNELVKVTEKATKNLNADLRIYFSDAVVDSLWQGDYKTIQKGENLGHRMKNAFIEGFEDDYRSIVLIGSDLPDISSDHINNGLHALNKTEVVFGPAQDGGYYLVGMSRLHHIIFDDKPWSQANLLTKTLEEIKKNDLSYHLLKPLNDIDTYEDLIASEFFRSNKALKQRIKQLND